MVLSKINLGLTGKTAVGERAIYFGGRLHGIEQRPLFTMSEVEYDAARQCRRHTHGRAFFALVTRGHYRECSGSTRLAYRPFDVGFHPEGTEHADQVDVDRTRFFLVELERDWARQLADDARTSVAGPMVCSSETAWLAARLCRAFRSGDRDMPLVAEDLIARMWGSVSASPRLERTRPPWIETVVAYLRSEFASPLTLAQVDRTVDLHPVYLSRAFRQFVGEGLGHYLNRLRIQKALCYLANSDMSIVESALRSGFSDQSRLNKVVKRATGMTPGGFRDLSQRERAGRANRSKCPSPGRMID